MRAVIQRASAARVVVDGEVVGQLPAGSKGLVVLLAAGQGDSDQDATALADKVARLRIFGDEDGKMNLSVVDIEGAMLVISQFTLFGDCRKGRRPSFVAAMEPVEAQRLVEVFVERARTHLGVVETGRFRAHMEVELTNDGPVTLLLDSRKQF